MRGWVVNFAEGGETFETERVGQRPVFYFESDGAPCFEVWFPDIRLQRWFVMSYQRIPALEMQGVIFFTPEDTPVRLREMVGNLRRLQGIA